MVFTLIHLAIGIRPNAWIGHFLVIFSSLFATKSDSFTIRVNNFSETKYVKIWYEHDQLVQHGWKWRQTAPQAAIFSAPLFAINFCVHQFHALARTASQEWWNRKCSLISALCYLSGGVWLIDSRLREFYAELAAYLLTRLVDSSEKNFAFANV